MKTNGSILIVDDEKGQREILNLILKKEDYDVVDVPGVREALEQLEQREFDLIMTDLKMQGQSGLDLLEKVLADDPQQCIIMMTAHGTTETAIEATKLGACDYLLKPFEADDLLDMVARAVASSRLMHHNTHRNLAIIPHRQICRLHLRRSCSIPRPCRLHPRPTRWATSGPLPRSR